jgi:hypothetical protein
MGEGLDVEGMTRQEEDWRVIEPGTFGQDPWAETLPYGGIQGRGKRNIEYQRDNPEPLGPPEMRPVDVEHIEDTPGRRITDITPDSIKPGQQYAMMKNVIGDPIQGDPLTTEINQQAGTLRGGVQPGRGKAPKLTMEETGDRKGWGNTNTKAFNFKNEEGKTIGNLYLTPKREGKDLYVEMVDAWKLGGPNKLGPSVMRDVLRQVKEKFPDAERLYGFRVSGARAQEGSKGMDNAAIALKPGVKTEDVSRDAIQAARMRELERIISDTQERHGRYQRARELERGISAAEDALREIGVPRR